MFFVESAVSGLFDLFLTLVTLSNRFPKRRDNLRFLFDLDLHDYHTKIAVQAASSDS